MNEALVFYAHPQENKKTNMDTDTHIMSLSGRGASHLESEIS